MCGWSSDGAITRVGELHQVEQLPLIALRRRAEGPQTLPLLRTALTAAYGGRAGALVLAGLEGVFRLLTGAERHRLRLQLAACESLSADERALLALIAAAQRGDHAHTRAVTAWLVHPADAPLLAQAVELIARALTGARRAPPAGKGQPSIDMAPLGPDARLSISNTRAQ